MRTIGGRAAAIMAAVVLTSTAACTDEEPTPPSPTTSSSTPTSPTPTSSSPAPQPESAEDFIRRWAAANNDMKNSGDPAAFLELTKSCDPCQRLVDTVTGFYRHGGYVKSDGWRVTAVVKSETPSSRERVYLVDVTSGATEYKRSKSGPVLHLTGGEARYRFSLLKSGESWRVTDYMEVPL